MLCKNEVVKSVCEKMDTAETLIKQVMEIIQSLLILVPPLVVDCCPNPDMCSGAYGKSAVSFNATEYVTTRSALFYSYQGESEAKYGAYSSIASINKLPVPVFPSFDEVEKLETHTRLDERKLLEGNMEGNGTQEGKCLSEVDDKHEDEQENEMFSGNVIAKTDRNTALSVIQSVTEYTCDKETQTDEFSGCQGVNTKKSRSRRMSPVRKGRYHNEVTNGRRNPATDIEKAKVHTRALFPMPPMIGGKSENDKQYHTSLRKKSQAPLLPDQCKAFHRTYHEHYVQSTTHITTDIHYHEQSQSTTVDIHHEQTNPNAVGDTELVKVCSVQSDTKKDNSEEQSNTKKDNSEEQSDTKKDNSEEQPDAEKDNSEEQSDTKKDNSEQCDTKKDNSEEESDTKKDNSEEHSDKKDNSEEQSDTKKDNSEEQSDTKKDNSEEQSDTKKDNSEEQSDTKKDNSEEQSDTKKDNSEEQSDTKKDNSEEQSDTKKDNSEEQSDTKKDNSEELSDNKDTSSGCTLS